MADLEELLKGTQDITSQVAQAADEESVGRFAAKDLNPSGKFANKGLNLVGVPDEVVPPNQESGDALEQSRGSYGRLAVDPAKVRDLLTTVGHIIKEPVDAADRIMKRGPVHPNDLTDADVKDYLLASSPVAAGSAVGRAPAGSVGITPQRLLQREDTQRAIAKWRSEGLSRSEVADRVNQRFQDVLLDEGTEVTTAHIRTLENGGYPSNSRRGGVDRKDAITNRQEKPNMPPNKYRATGGPPQYDENGEEIDPYLEMLSGQEGDASLQGGPSIQQQPEGVPDGWLAWHENKLRQIQNGELGIEDVEGDRNKALIKQELQRRQQENIPSEETPGMGPDLEKAAEPKTFAQEEEMRRQAKEVDDEERQIYTQAIEEGRRSQERWAKLLREAQEAGDQDAVQRYSNRLQQVEQGLMNAENQIIVPKVDTFSRQQAQEQAGQPRPSAPATPPVTQVINVEGKTNSPLEAIQQHKDAPPGTVLKVGEKTGDHIFIQRVETGWIILDNDPTREEKK